MHSFKDRTGRVWSMEATFGSYSRVKSQTGVSLFEIATEQRKCLEQLADPFTLGAVIWSMIEPQAESRGITPEQFYAEFDGTALKAAYDALIDEMIFFCQPHQRTILTAAVRKVRDAERAAEKVIGERMPEIERELDAEIARWTSGSSATNSPASSESTPAPGRSANSLRRSKAGSANSGTTRRHSSPS
jgi:hypothetical protein